MKRLVAKTPLKWYGGKGYYGRRIAQMMPRHHRYVEVFGGGASVLLAKPPAPVEVYNDLDEGLVNFYRVLRDPDMFEQFQMWANLTPFSREEWRHCRDHWDKHPDPVKRAFAWWVVARQSFSGAFGRSWSHSMDGSARGMSQAVSAWLSAIEGLPEVHARMRTVQVECLDFRRCIEKYDGASTLFYLDPPYLPNTRHKKCRDIYAYEMTPSDHAELVDLCINVRGYVILSGYPNSLYERLVETGGRRIDISATCWATARTAQNKTLGEGSIRQNAKRTESIWFNKKLNKESQV